MGGWSGTVDDDVLVLGQLAHAGFGLGVRDVDRARHVLLRKLGGGTRVDEQGVAYQSTSNFNGAGNDLTGLKAAASVAMGDFSAGLLWSRLDNDVGKKTNNYVVSGTYKLGTVVFKGNYGQSSATASGAADGLKMWAVEADWLLDKNTALYAYYVKINNDTNARGRLEAGENTYTPVAGKDPSALAIGLRYNF